MPQPYAEVIAAPYTVWVAPNDTVFPAIDADPSTFGASWVKLGVNGLNNYGTAGVTLNLGETIQEFTPAGDTLPVKAFRTDEKISVALSLVDTSVETLAAILDEATITTVAAGAGVAGFKSIKLKRGLQVHTYALLVRGLSPYDDTGVMNAQYTFTRAYQSGSQSPKYVKGTPAEFACEWTIMGDVAGNDPAVYAAQNALAS